MLKLMYITNNTAVAKIAENAGVDRIFIDMEYIGKESRQGGLDTVKSHHTFNDIAIIKSVLNRAEIVARINPIHNKDAIYCGTEEEIEQSIKAGTDYIMLPMFKTKSEIMRFTSTVDKKAKTVLLVETPEAVENLDDILEVPGIDEIHIGLNDLHLAYKMKFMFQLLADGTVEKIATKIKAHNIAFGFGGIARIGYGLLPSEYVIAEHYRLGSSMAILSRSFCDACKIQDSKSLTSLFYDEVMRIRQREIEVSRFDKLMFETNKNEVVTLVDKIINSD